MFPQSARSVGSASAEILAACLKPDVFFDVLDRYPGTVARIDADLTIHLLPDD